jgi:hypothetical protein
MIVDEQCWNILELKDDGLDKCHKMVYNGHTTKEFLWVQ